MAEDVVVVEGEESPESAPTTPAGDDLTTLRKRLSGKDQAYAKLKAEHEEAMSRLNDLSKRLAEREEADLSEVERLQKRLAKAEERAKAAEQAAERERLARTYPNAVEALGDDALLPEERLAALEQRLAPKPGTEEETEPIVDPNQPPRLQKGQKSLEDMDEAELVEALRVAGQSIGSLEDMESWAG